MRFITNENIPGGLVAALRSSGHDVLSVKESMRGEQDAAILKRGVAEDRLVVTQDKDFAELVFRLGMPADCGVVLFRLSGESPEMDQERMREVLTGTLDLRGYFTVATDDRIRTRPVGARTGSTELPEVSD